MSHPPLWKLLVCFPRNFPPPPPPSPFFVAMFWRSCVVPFLFHTFSDFFFCLQPSLSRGKKREREREEKGSFFCRVKGALISLKPGVAFRAREEGGGRREGGMDIKDKSWKARMNSLPATENAKMPTRTTRLRRMDL